MLYCGRSFWAYYFCKHARTEGVCGAPFVCPFAETACGLDPKTEVCRKLLESRQSHSFVSEKHSVWVKVLIVELFLLLVAFVFLLIRGGVKYF